MRYEGLEALFGHTEGAHVLVVTPAGVELPIGNAKGWSVAALAETVGDIENLPELAPDSRRA